MSHGLGTQRVSPNVLWSPHNDEHFIVATQHIRLFRASSIPAPLAVLTNRHFTFGHRRALPPTLTALANQSTNTIINATGGATIDATHGHGNDATFDGRQSLVMGSTSATGDDVKGTELAIDDLPPLVGRNVQFSLLDTANYQQQPIKCVTWCTDSNDPTVIAGGMASGRVALFRLDDASNRVTQSSSSDNGGHRTSHVMASSSSSSSSSNASTRRVVREFVPKYTRPCNAIAWNKQTTNILAVGLERMRNGHGTLIWDINQRSSSTPAVATASSYGRVDSYVDPVISLTNGEGAVAMSWLPDVPQCLAVGTNFKWLRIFDIRGVMRPLTLIASPKSVFGVEFDPFQPKHFVTHSEDGIVKLWDLRTLQRAQPLLQIYTAATTTSSISSSGVVSSSTSVTTPSGSKPAKKSSQLQSIAFCPTRPGLLSTINRDEEFIRLWDLSGATNDERPQLRMIEGQESNPPCRHHYTSGGLTSLSWHPNIKQRLICSTDNQYIEDISLRESVPIAFAPDNALTFASNETLYLGLTNTNINTNSNSTNSNINGITPAPLASSSSSSIGTTSVVPMITQSSRILPSPDVIPFTDEHGIEGDISSVIRRRVELGYSLCVEDNLRICRSLPYHHHLLRVWQWIDHCEAICREQLTAVATPPPVPSSVSSLPLSDTKASSQSSVSSSSSSNAMISPDMDPSDIIKRRFAGLYKLLVPDAIAKEMKDNYMASAAAQATATTSVSATPSSSSATTTSSTSGNGNSEWKDASVHVPLSSPVTGAAARTMMPPVRPSSSSSSLPTPSILLDTGDHLLSSFRVHYSPQRSHAIRLCRWWDVFTPANMASITSASGSGAGSVSRSSITAATTIYAASTAQTTEHLNLENALRALEDQGQYEKAAALSLFHLNIGRALQALSKGTQHLVASSSSSSISNMSNQQQDLALVAVALAGYSASSESSVAGAPSSRSLWRDTYQNTLKHTLTHPYLRAAFAFLASGPARPGTPAFLSILDDSSVELRERVAFACRFLPDTQLYEFLDRATMTALDESDLDGLLLTGLNTIGTDLIQTYVDRTADVQTAACLGSIASSLAVADGSEPDERHGRWITLYSSLLNSWKYWSKRAKFDVARALLNSHQQFGDLRLTGMATSSSRPSSPSVGSTISTTVFATSVTNSSKNLRRDKLQGIKPQVYARCNYCSQSLSLDAVPGAKKGPTPFRATQAIRSPKAPATASRIRACPSCKKSLPRCALCLVALDCAAPKVAGAKGKDADGDESKKTMRRDSLSDPRFDRSSMTAFGQWFTWCQACRHGGHADHINDWFRTHTECAVTDCACNCMSLDLVQSAS